MIITEREELQQGPAIFKNKLFDKNKVMEVIKEAVANYYDVPISVYDDKGRNHKYVKSRQVAMYIIKKVAGQRISLAEIGAEMGKKDHATVLYGIRRVSELSSVEKFFKSELNEIMRIIGIAPSTVDFSKNISEGVYYLNLNDITVLKINNNCSISFSGITESVVRQIREQFFKGPQITVKSFKNTGLYFLKNENPEQESENKKSENKVSLNTSNYNNIK
jgi:hypothetical protein